MLSLSPEENFNLKNGLGAKVPIKADHITPRKLIWTCNSPMGLNELSFEKKIYNKIKKIKKKKQITNNRNSING